MSEVCKILGYAKYLQAIAYMQIFSYVNYHEKNLDFSTNGLLQ